MYSVKIFLCLLIWGLAPILIAEAEEAKKIQVDFCLVCENNEPGCLKKIASNTLEKLKIQPKIEIDINDIEYAEMKKSSESESISKKGYLEDKFSDSFSEFTIYLTKDGSKKFMDLTARNIGKRLAILINGEIIMAPTIRESIQSGQINIMAPGTFNSEIEQIITEINRSKK